MSETIVYLVPKTPFKTGVFKTKTVNVLSELEVINGFYDEFYSWYAAGRNAGLLFGLPPVNNNLRFEYVEIHDNANSRLLPEGLIEPVLCRFCSADVQEVLNELLYAISEKEYDEKIETDMAAAQLVCPNCRKESKFADLDYKEKVVITNQYLCFVAIDDSLSEEVLEKIGNQIGTAFEIIYSSI